jgi:hypothetical protein
MRILVGCEYSGIVRRAFAAIGHDAWSCDFLPAEDGSNKHFIGDVRNYLDLNWDLLAVMHPPCTRLCNSGVRWLSAPPTGKTLPQIWSELDEAAELFSDLWNVDETHGITRVCIENPVMHKHAKARIKNYRDFSQSVQPWQFGHGECKRTCFWLKNLPLLTPTNVVDGREHRVHKMPPGPNRWKERSRFYPGIAQAMAAQWGYL